MNKKGNIKAKIKALLDKTTENGASEQEALSALSKAQELMKQYFISENDLKGDFAGEECVMKITDAYASFYDLGLYLAELSRLFDCKYFYTKSNILFFGFEQDTELCVYFYKFLTKTTFIKVKEFKKTARYEYLKKQYHGRSLIASYIKGFEIGVAQKIMGMYEERQRNVSQSTGLVIYTKTEKVKEALEKMDLNVRKVTPTITGETTSFQLGHIDGSEIEIVQGIEAKQEFNNLRNE